MLASRNIIDFGKKLVHLRKILAPAAGSTARFARKVIKFFFVNGPRNFFRLFASESRSFRGFLTENQESEAAGDPESRIKNHRRGLKRFEAAWQSASSAGARRGNSTPIQALARTWRASSSRRHPRPRDRPRWRPPRAATHAAPRAAAATSPRLLPQSLARRRQRRPTRARAPRPPRRAATSHSRTGPFRSRGSARSAPRCGECGALGGWRGSARRRAAWCALRAARSERVRLVRGLGWAGHRWLGGGW